MQYILTEEEYQALLNANTAFAKKHEETLQKLCTMVADHMPVKKPWDKKAAPQPWGCLLTMKGEWYCDECPVSDYCPYPYKEYSK